MRRDWTGTILGLLVFAGGVALLVFVFREAMAMYNRPASAALGMRSGQQIDVTAAGSNLANALIKVLLLALMAFIGGLVCRAGVQLYGRSLGPRPPKTPVEG